MPLIAAKCTQCGANIEIDNTKEAGICQYCGTAFITEKAIINYNTQITNNFAGATINVSDVNVENLLILAKDTEEMGNFLEARDYYTNVLEHQSNNCRALLGICLCSLHIIISSPERNLKYASKAIEYKKKEQDISDEEINKFIIDSANELYQVAMHYSEFCFSVRLDQDWLRDVIKVFQYVVQITEPNDIQQIPDGKYYYISSMKSIVKCCVELCKLPINDRQSYVELHDNMCSKIKESNPDYKPTEEINRKQGGCYIATCVYGSYDCPEVWTLRRFRDYYLMRKFWGKIFVKIYYKTSPTIVKIFGNQTAFKRFWMYWLDKFIDNLKTRGYEDTNYYDN